MSKLEQIPCFREKESDSEVIAGASSFTRRSLLDVMRGVIEPKVCDRVAYETRGDIVVLEVDGLRLIVDGFKRRYRQGV